MMVLAKSPTSLSMILVFTLIMQTFLLKIPLFFEISWLKSLDELVTLVAAACVLIYLQKKPAKEVEFYLKLSLLFGCFCFMGVASGLFNGLSLSQIVMQFVLELKILITIVFCMVSFNGIKTDEFFSNLFRFLVLINIPFVLWQLFSGESYDAFFASGAHFALFYDSEGSEFTRVAGIFWFTGAFAVFCSLACGYFLVCNLVTRRFDINTFYFMISASMLLATRSKGELYGFVFGVIILVLAYKSSGGYRFLVTLILTTLLGLVFYTNAELFTRLAGQLGLVSGLPEYTARALFMVTSLDIAKDNFPFGSGFGSFGGQSAVVHDSALFYKYYISHEWYFSEGLFLTDTFWPKIIAESGWIGCMFMLAFLLYPILKCYKKKHPYHLFSIYALSMMFFQSLSAPIYNEPLSVFFSYFMLGAIFRHEY